MPATWWATARWSACCCASCCTPVPRRCDHRRLPRTTVRSSSEAAGRPDARAQAEFFNTPLSIHFRQPTIHIMVLFVEEKESIARQLKRGRETLATTRGAAVWRGPTERRPADRPRRNTGRGDIRRSRSRRGTPCGRSRRSFTTTSSTPRARFRRSSRISCGAPVSEHARARPRTVERLRGFLWRARSSCTPGRNW
jgi:hypothetical protein